MIVATNNKDKIREIKQIFGGEIKSLKDANIDIDVIEDQDTFYGNALKKAKEIYELVKEPVIADDSGICIEALNGFPGVLSHRFLGEDASESDRNEALIQMVKDKANRNATFVCNLVYYDGKDIIGGEGVLQGTISYFPRGEYGFGFDKILELENGQTVGELKPEEKNVLSARYLAATDLKSKLLKRNNTLSRKL